MTARSPIPTHAQLCRRVAPVPSRSDDQRIMAAAPLRHRATTVQSTLGGLLPHRNRTRHAALQRPARAPTHSLTRRYRPRRRRSGWALARRCAPALCLYSLPCTRGSWGPLRSIHHSATCILLMPAIVPSRTVVANGRPVGDTSASRVHACPAHAAQLGVPRDEHPGARLMNRSVGAKINISAASGSWRSRPNRASRRR